MQLPELKEGEIYIGGTVDSKGVIAHIILLPGDNDVAQWQAQMDWAKSIGGDLPNRVEQLMLWATTKDEFKENRYWSNETDASDASYVRYQDFSYGYQGLNRKDYELRARAVRRVVTQLENKGIEMKVELGKKYRTKSGLPVRILCVDRMSQYDTAYVIALITLANEEVTAYYTLGGTHFPHNPLGDLVEVNEWDACKVDDKVMISDSGVHWEKRYFAGVTTDGRPLSFLDGMSSWTADESQICSWKYCRLPTAEELE